MKFDLNKLSVPSQLEEFASNAAAKIAKSFVTAAHMEAISEYCMKNKLTLSIRETGVFSLMRIAQGSKPKPHSMLQKTIKPDSLRKKYPEIADALENNKNANESLKIQGVPVKDLLGFVGHWAEDGTLLGVGLNRNDVLGKENDSEDLNLAALQKFITKDPVTQDPYIKLSDFNSFKEEMGQNWQHSLYTGDYDLGEIYKNGKPIMEGSTEKARILDGLNNAIARKQEADENNTNPIRRGSFVVKRASLTKSNGRRLSSHLLHPQKGSEYAMFQHGDQMGYLTNQYNEHISQETELRKSLKQKSQDKENSFSPKRGKAELVEAVAKEPDGALAWCSKAEWLLTNNKAEHKMLRQAKNLNVSSAWSEKMEKKIKENKSKVFKYKN